MGLATISGLQSGHDRQVFIRLFQQPAVLWRSNTSPRRIAHCPKQQLQPVQLRHQQRIATGGRNRIVELVVQTSRQIDKPLPAEIPGGEQPPELPRQMVKQLGRDASTGPPDRLTFESPPDMDEVDEVTRAHPTNHCPPIGTQFDNTDPRQG